MSDQAPITSLEQAEALLGNAIEAEKPGYVAPEPVAPDSAQVPVTPEQPAEAPDLFADADVDLTNLSPAEELRIRQMQAHFTRRTQELAEQRKAFGDVDPQQALEAVQFVNELQNNPQYALQVHQELSQALQQAGLTPAEANAVATQQVQEQSNVDAYGLDDEDIWQPEVEYRVPPEIQQQLNELTAWREQQEQESQRQYYANELQQQESQIREAHPEWKQADIDSVYERAFAYGGDLQAAAQSLADEQNRIISSYLQQKAQVPSGQPVSGGPAEPQPHLSFDQAHEAAQAHLRNLAAQGLI